MAQGEVVMRLLKKLYVSCVAASGPTALDHAEHNFYAVDL